MKSLLYLFVFFLFSCEKLIFSDYKILRNYSKPSGISNSYNVKKGDTIYSISKRFNVSVREIIDFNNIKIPYRIFPNQKINIPQQNFYIVKKGDTLYSISRRYNSDLFNLSKVNKIKNVDEIFKGQKLIIPNKTFSSHRISMRKKKVSEKKKNLKNISKTKISFQWPLKGRIISRFGSNNPGFYNDGINISSNSGVEVLASCEGQIVYTGNEIPGYGNLILIKHSKNWITAYAHLQEIFFKKGSRVKQGQLIGSVGNSGNVKVPQLHFEIRRGKTAVDPLKYLS